ncbi:MAG: sulfotransferase [Melioribacteraceae bacterium]|nr:sulfotransferase [Melioribacteraceae bacterium]
MLDYNNLWNSVEKLPWCALVTTGRVGSDFFQSLLDSHPEVFVFNGTLFFHEFWQQSYCANYQGDVDIQDLVDEFIGYNIIKFKSKYDYQERKNQLGLKMDQSISIDIDLFKKHMISLFDFRTINSKNFLIAVYTVYALLLGQDLSRKKLFFHHIHHIWKLDPYLKDFPDSKIISMTRDPRATFVSGVEHWRKYDPKTDTPAHVFFVLKRTIDDAKELKKYPNEFRVLRLEDLGDNKCLHLVCIWLCVSFHQCMNQSTWGGLKWWGDRLSQSKVLENEHGFSPTLAKNNSWKTKLSKIDKALFNYLLADRLQWYSYENQPRTNIFYSLLIFFIILTPLTYEKRFISFHYIFTNLKERKYKKAVAGLYNYSKRIILFYKLFMTCPNKLYQ